MKHAHGRAVLTGLLLVSTAALATQSVTFNGRNYTCTNQCVITVSGGSYTITDSNNGSVKVSYPGNQEK